MGPFAAGLLVFFSSAAVLVLEILAGRLLAPYVGVRLETYTGIIGTVLAGISLGTWLGGRLADRVDPRRTLGALLVVAGAFTLWVVPAVRLLGQMPLGRGPTAIVLLAFVFFPPAALLSAVGPTVVKLQLDDLEVTGRVVGRLSALGTAGAIFGTFATGFVLVAALPTRPIVLGLGVLVVMTGAALHWRLAPRGRAGLGALLVTGLVAGGLAAAPSSPCQHETPYFCARVETDPERPSGRVLVLDTLHHSYVDLADATYLGFGYTRSIADVVGAAFPEERPLRALHIGGGGFTLPRYIAATRAGSTSVVLEIDATLVEIARTRLGLVTGPDLLVRVGDARLALRDEATGAYDVVIGDAFGGLAVPWHLTTRQFVEEVRRTLRPGGVYAVNVIDNPPLRFARAEAATLAAVFAHTAVVASRDQATGRVGGNFVLVGSDAPLDLAAIRAGDAARGGGKDARPGTTFAEDAPVLTDDYAPVDQLLTARAD